MLIVDWKFVVTVTSVNANKASSLIGFLEWFNFNFSVADIIAQIRAKATTLQEKTISLKEIARQEDTKSR